MLWKCAKRRAGDAPVMHDSTAARLTITWETAAGDTAIRRASSEPDQLALGDSVKGLAP